MSSLSLSIQSALNLTLQGSVGSFSAGSKDAMGVEVKYFLTHVGLDFETGSNTAALPHLAPVRELFATNSLEFDEIMQRDIDDARVSGELIPYLLDPAARDLVKLFPPIVVVILPTTPGEDRPADKYPKVEPGSFKRQEKPEDPPQEFITLRAGPKGNEVFEFEQPMVDGRLVEHDLCRLRLNTNRCKLVIVDGQHRAMALLAIFRNLKQGWSDERRAPYKSYYEEWTPEYIKKFSLKQISLPVMFCTFPQLDENFTGDYDLKKAARAIFLTLNKTARAVSESRNKLLDDNDLVAYFLRSTLSRVKSKDTRSPHSLRIHNIELDQAQDRKRLDNPIAISGVNHIYYLIEHLLFNEPGKDVNGAKPRSGKFSHRTDLSSYGAFKRLGNARDYLGEDVAAATSRLNFSSEAAEKMTEPFFLNMGQFIIGFLERFLPYEAHNRASLRLEEVLRAHDNQKLRPILFEGQGLHRVFEKHRENLKTKRDSFGANATQIDEICKRLDDTAAQVQQYVDRFKEYRSAQYLDSVQDKPALKVGDSYSPRVRSFVDELFTNVFTAVAFQTAAVATFLCEVEAAAKVTSKEGRLIDVRPEFDRFLTSLESFFSPKSSSKLKKLVAVFAGDLEGSIAEWQLKKTRYTFREVVYPGEMQPDQWPKYRYLILELWAPVDQALQGRVLSERQICRGQVFDSLHSRVKAEYLVNRNKLEEELSSEERSIIDQTAFDYLKTFLSNVGATASDLPKLGELKLIASRELAAESEADESEAEVWSGTST